MNGKAIMQRLIAWYKEGSKWEEGQQMRAARKRLDEPQRPNEFTRKQAVIEAAERRARYES